MYPMANISRNGCKVLNVQVVKVNWLALCDRHN